MKTEVEVVTYLRRVLCGGEALRVLVVIVAVPLAVLVGLQLGLGLGQGRVVFARGRARLCPVNESKGLALSSWPHQQARRHPRIDDEIN